MVKAKHNKKRNTAFLYEVLVKEMTKAIVEKDAAHKDTVSSIIKEHFGKNTVLGRELVLYKTLVETTNVTAGVAEKLLSETKKARLTLKDDAIFTNQTAVINKINKSLPKESWNTFVSNFKSLATVSAIFGDSVSVKQRVLYEDAVLGWMGSTEEVVDTHLQPIDNIVYRSFVKKYNEEYTGLLKEQKDLLSKYIASFADNGLELKLYLNEEIGRLKTTVKDSLELKEVSLDKSMVEKTKEVLRILESYRESEPTKEVVSTVLKVQELAREIQTND